MSELEQYDSMNQATTVWKAIAYLLLIPGIGLIVYGGGRFIIGTFLVANATGSVYQLMCLPAIIFLTPLAMFYLPYRLVRDATPTGVRNLIILALVLIGLAINFAVFAPGWARVLWGL